MTAGQSCSTCGAPLRADASFCTTCGTPVDAPREPTSTDTVPPPTSGQPTPERGPAAPSTTDWGTFSRQLLGGSGPLGAIGGLVVVWFVSAFLSRQLWDVLRWPAEQVQDFVSQRDCTAYQPGTFDMYTCSIRVGFFQVLGSLVVVLIALVLRRPIVAGINRIKKQLPAGQNLVAPLASTMLFTMAYAHMHRDTAAQEGIVAQKTFPAFVGVATFVIGRFGPTIARKLAGPLTKRDRVPLLLRVPLAMLVPIGLSYLLTNQDRVTDPAKKEQWVILVSLVVGYLAVVPRSGRLQLGGRLLRRTTRGATP